MRGYDPRLVLGRGPASQKYIQFLDHEVATQAFPRIWNSKDLCIPLAAESRLKLQ